jgi:DNA-binding SARP family transcriptional activator
MIELKALGASEIRTGVATLTPSQGIVFASALYMVVERGKPVSRALLAQTLWPDIDPSARAHRLRQTILQLKKLGFVLLADRDNVQLQKENVRSDLDQVGDVSTDASGRRSVDFLPGYDPAFSSAFSEWLDGVRNAFQSSAVTALVKQLNHARVRGDWQCIDLIAAKCLTLDPYNEEAVLAKAEAAAMRGSKHKAISILDDYLSEIGDSSRDLKLPAAILRRRVVERVPDRATPLNTEPEFVGREGEMATLTQCFERARIGNGSAVLLIGEPGIGKTRLSAELARFAELRGAQVQRATCRRADVDRPLSLFVDIVPQLRELPGSLGCAPETLSCLKRLTEFQQKPDDLFRSLAAEMLFEHVRAALFDLLESITDEHCLVIVIDDVQWLDKTSSNLLARMAEWSHARRILFVLNGRDNFDSFFEYAEANAVLTVALGPLERHASTALLRSVAVRSGDEPKEPFVEWCIVAADGNPFFLQELAHQWMESGCQYEAPPSMSRVLQERLSRLSNDALRILQTCAILNDYATLDRVERVLEYATHQLLSAVDELSSAAMIQSPSDKAELYGTQLQPKHDFLASAAVSRLPPMALAYLHRRCADVLETELVGKTASAALLWACATHRHQAGDHSRAIALRISCAEHLLKVGLSRDACLAYEKTVEYCSTDSERLSVLSRMASALELDGEWTRSIQTLVVCQALLTKIESAPNGHNEFELLMLDTRHRSALDFANLLDATLACVNCEAASPRHRVGAAVLALKLAVDFGRTDYLEAIYRKISAFLGTADVSELNSAQVEVIYRTMLSDRPVPIEQLRELADIARRTEGELGYSSALLMVISACRLSGRYEDGLRFVADALDHAEVHRLGSRRREILLQKILLHTRAGAFEEAKTVLDELRSCASTSDSAKERNELNTLETRLAIERGDFALAATAFAKIDPPSVEYSVTRRGFYLALELRIRLSRGETGTLIQSLVAQLEVTYTQMLTSGSQEFECYALYMGFCALGQNRRALDILRRHIEHRRNDWPVLPMIIGELTRAKVEARPLQLAQRQPEETAALSTVPLSGVL